MQASAKGKSNSIKMHFFKHLFNGLLKYLKHSSFRAPQKVRERKDPISPLFGNVALFLLGYTFLVVLWGAWVRISRSGDGCGQSWPLCHGQVLPQELGTSPTLSIEFFHRLSSGLYGIFLLVFFIWALRIFPSGHGARKGALLCLIFTVSEALIGAHLVLKGLVVDNASSLRALSMGLHLINTFFLTGSLILTHHLSQYQRPQWVRPPLQALLGSGLALLFFFILGGSGTIATLASQLFPSSGLYEGFQQDFSSQGPWFLQWRILHPLLGLSSLLLFLYLLAVLKPFHSSPQKVFRWPLHWTLLSCIALGLSSLLLLSPSWAKLSHLLLAHLFYVCLLKLLLPIFTREKSPEVSKT